MRTITGALVALAAIGLSGCQGKVENMKVERQCFAELVTALSADAMEGRGIGTEGLEQAALLIEEQFRKAGLSDMGTDYRQPFDVTVGVRLGEGNTLSSGSDEALSVGEDFQPFGFSSNGAFEGKLVFAGYGIMAEELGYDDYADLDVTDKIVLAMRYEPQETDPDSKFEGNKPSRYSDLRYKALQARTRGAKALIVVGPARESSDPDKVPALQSGGPTSRAGLPIIQITREVADRWLARAEAPTLAELHATIDETGAPASRELPLVDVAGAVDLVSERAQVRNVLAAIPGSGDLIDDVVVVGAHYDHLGYGGSGSMRPGERAIHNGADDNASGTAAMICAMQALAGQSAPEHRRTILGIAFTAEEIGLGGSAYYADHPVLPIEDTVAMVNLDMVGRVRDGALQALGADTAPEWRSLLALLATPYEFDLAMGGDGYGASDHTSFYEKQIPVIHLFSGTHTEYHTPDDDASTINLEGGALVTAFLGDVLGELSTRAERLTYVKSSAGPRVRGDSRSRGAYLGTIPDMSAMALEEGGTGVLLSDVRGDGPADRAGIQGGDVIVAMAGVDIQNLYDMTFVLRDHRPGQTIDVDVMRGEERITLQATLGSRAKRSSKRAATRAADNPGTHASFAVGTTDGATDGWAPKAGKPVPELVQADEKHLADLRQLTFGGENAEANWSPDGRKLVFRRTPGPDSCDQQYLLDLDTGDVSLVSSGKGRTTHGHYTFPQPDAVIYATTEQAGAACPEPPDRSQGYVWPINDAFDIVRQAPGEAPTPLIASPEYDAEATVCMADGRIVFTSTRDGDLDLYVANADGTGIERITDTPGYDGGAFFNPSCTALIWRASRPEGDALADYQRLLNSDLVRPSELEIFWMDLASRKVEQLTTNGAANVAPYPLPDDSGVLFSSNLGASPREFDLYRASRQGGEPERVTTAKGFDGFPTFSPDGKWLVFASNRATAEGADGTNLFVARWVP